MSWIIGEVSKNKVRKENLLKIIDEQILFKVESDNLLLYSGNSSVAVSVSKNISENSGWIVLGVGITNDTDKTTILTDLQWNSLLQKNTPYEIQNNLNGHFIIIKWNEEEISFHTDILGVRDIYIKEETDKIIFSTNSLWLTKVTNSEINFLEFGSKWLLFNQISDKSIFKNITRIVEGKSITINRTNLSLQYGKKAKLNFKRDNKHFNLEELSEKFAKLINVVPPGSGSLSLSLSGGMDSRVLLSFLLKTKNENFDAHTFNNNSTDSIVASEIALKFGIKHELIDLHPSTPEEAIKQITKATSKTLVNNPASTFMHLQNYTPLYKKNSVIIDGGFGEIWRREFFYKLFLNAKKEFMQNNIEKILPYLLLKRGDIFTDEISSEMELGCKTQLEEVLTILPVNTSVEDRFDLFTLKTRLLNHFAAEQIRLDNYVTSFMPFIQPIILQDLLSVPIAIRKNSNLFKKFIKLNMNELYKIPLAKGSSTHPLFFTTLQTRVWSHLIKKVKPVHSNFTNTLLNYLKEFITDTINSRSVRECPYYRYKKIETAVKAYYKGDLSYAGLLDWWLSFELFRTEI